MKHKYFNLLAALLFSIGAPLQAQVFTLLHSFELSDGGEPYAGLQVIGKTLYGTTSSGGATDNGNVFSVKTDGSNFRDLHDFVLPAEASFCRAGLVVSGTNFYGPAYQGGVNSDGAVFAINKNGSGYTNLYVFTGGQDGSDPRGAVILSSNVLYGTTQTGGSGHGTVFEVSTTNAGFSTLHTFAGPDGDQPYGGLVLSTNVLYGMTYDGGASNNGVIYAVQNDGTLFRVVHDFSIGDGSQLTGTLVYTNGTLYGTASAGGASHLGTVFSVNTDGSGFTVMHSFANVATDGTAPLGGLILSGGVLYGTASGGGASGNGAVFSINTNGSGFTLIHSFNIGPDDGGDPEAPLLLVNNALYGTTVEGGDSGNGTVFSVTLTGVGFVAQPQSQVNVSPTASVGFGAAALDATLPSTPLQYQWRLNGVNIPGATDVSYGLSSVQPTNGGNYTLSVSDGSDAPTTAPALLALSLPTATGNGTFANRSPLPAATSGVVSTDNTNAISEAGEPVILAGNPGGKPIWFSWKPTSAGIVVFNTEGSSFDTIIGVFKGTSLTSLVREPSAISDDDSGGFLTSKVTFNFSANTEYEIVVDGYWGASGHVVLNWSVPSGSGLLPTITQAPPIQTIVSNGANVQLFCSFTQGNGCTWLFNGQPTSVSGNIFNIPSMTVSNVGTYVAVVSGAGGSVATEPVHLQINTTDTGLTDTNSIAWNKYLDATSAAFVAPPPGSALVRNNGGDTRGFSVSQTFSTIGANSEPSEPNVCGQIGGSPVWYAYVAPTNGALRINTTGSSFNTILGVYDGPGDSFDTLTNLGCDFTTNYILNGQPEVFFGNVVAGQTNFIVVDGIGGSSGIVHLSIFLGSPAIISTPPQSQTVAAGSNATLTVAADGSAPLSYYWQFAGTNITGATNATLTVTNVQSATAGAYTVVVSNLVGTASSAATLTLGIAPVINTQPLSHTVVSNSTAILTVTAHGTPSPSYQWLFNNTNTGLNTGALSIIHFQPSNEGTYSVVVSNFMGAVTSSNAIVLLNSPLRVGQPSLSGGAFSLQIVGVTGSNYVLEASSNLVNWVPVLTNTSTNGFLKLTDTNAASFGHRFYRGMTN